MTSSTYFQLVGVLSTLLLSSPAQSKDRASARVTQCEPSYEKGNEAAARKDWETAFCHWLPNARAGHAGTQNNLGYLYEQGLSVQAPKSDAQAVAWYEKSARQGDLNAIANLANLYARQGKADAANAWRRRSALIQAQAKEHPEAMSLAQAQAELKQSQAELARAQAEGRVLDQALALKQAQAQAQAQAAQNKAAKQRWWGEFLKGALAGTAKPPVVRCTTIDLGGVYRTRCQ